MSLTFEDVFVDFRQVDRDKLLAEWAWLLGSDHVPMAVTATGDAFLHKAANGYVYFLDTAEGSLHDVADSVDEWKELLNNPEFVGEYTSVQILDDLRTMGVTLAPGQVYGYKVPPVQGGMISPDNIEPVAIQAHFDAMGQACRQANEQAAAASPASASSDADAARPWWKFW